MAGTASPKEQFITNLGFKDPKPGTRQQIQESLTGADPQRLTQFNEAYQASLASGHPPADAAFSALAAGSSVDTQGDANFAAVVNNAFKMGAHLAVVDGHPAAKELYVAAARTEAYVKLDSRYAEADARGKTAYAADMQNKAAVAARIQAEAAARIQAETQAKTAADQTAAQKEQDLREHDRLAAGNHGRRPTVHRTALMASTHLSSPSDNMADQLNAEVLQNGKTRNIFASNAKINGDNQGQRELASTQAGGKLAHPGLGAVEAEALAAPPKAGKKPAEGQPTSQQSAAHRPQMGMHPFGFG